jgi:hypothetical protein
MTGPVLVSRQSLPGAVRVNPEATVPEPKLSWGEVDALRRHRSTEPESVSADASDGRERLKTRLRPERRGAEFACGQGKRRSQPAGSRPRRRAACISRGQAKVPLSTSCRCIDVRGQPVKVPGGSAGANESGQDELSMTALSISTATLSRRTSVPP